MGLRREGVCADYWDRCMVIWWRDRLGDFSVSIASDVILCIWVC